MFLFTFCTLDFKENTSDGSFRRLSIVTSNVRACVRARVLSHRNLQLTITTWSVLHEIAIQNLIWKRY